MKLRLMGVCAILAGLVVPAVVEWLRHRPHRLTTSTQHIVLAGAFVQLALLVLCGLIWSLL